MSDHKKEFDAVFKEYGGIVNHTSENVKSFFKMFTNSGYGIINALRKNNTNWPEVYIDYIENPNLNAIVTKYNDSYYIGINSGTVMLINQLFLRMLSSPNILPEWGDVSKEVETKKIFNAQINDFGLYYISSDPEQNIVPNDNLRKQLAELLTLNAMNFLIMHEYAHIINGHVDYLFSKTKKIFYSESAVDNGLDSMISQTLEYDADAFAARMGVNDINLRIAHLKVFPLEIQQLVGDFQKTLSLWSFSIIALFSLFGGRDIRFEKITSYSHPPKEIRAAIIFSIIATLLKKENEEFNEEIGELLTNENIKVYRAFDEISIKGFDYGSIKYITDRNAFTHMLNLSANWKNVRPLIEPFAVQKLAPINIDNN